MERNVNFRKKGGAQSGSRSAVTELLLGASICHLFLGCDTPFSGAVAQGNKNGKTHGGWAWREVIARKTQVSLHLFFHQLVGCFLAMEANGHREEL